ncbi:apoptotic protease-activating factor [Pimephales promelas]|nr:apoptotic protease-activating factor [Pimephales promelas]
MFSTQNSETASFSGFRACSSKDASKIVSCWPHKTLQVFKRSSREKLVELQAHDESGLFCIRRLLRPNERCLTIATHVPTAARWPSLSLVTLWSRGTLKPVKRKPTATVTRAGFVVSGFRPTAHCCRPLLRIRPRKTVKFSGHTRTVKPSSHVDPSVEESTLKKTHN